MGYLDLAIIFGYLAGVLVLGVWFSRKQLTTRNYFLGGRNIPWWAIAASIVATETSTVTFISVPGTVYAKGGNFQFLQLVFGYMLGRVVISLLFIPSYFRGELLTVYQLLEQRFGVRIKMLAASLFVVMRNIADGIRLLLTAIVLAAVFQAFQPVDAEGLQVVTFGAILLLGAVMVLFTFYGGMEAVVWVEVVQLGIYLAGAIAAAFVLAASLSGGWGEAIDVGQRFEKFDLFDFALNFKKPYTFWAGLIGGCFLTMSTHGTDQYLVQRYLCTDRPSRAAAALLSSGAVVLGQFIGFLFLGVLLFAFYQPFADPNYAELEAAKATLPVTGSYSVVTSDRVFPDFITRHMPPGLAGLVVAAIFAAALSSSLNSIAATAVNDLYKPLAAKRDDRHYLFVSGWLTVGWGLVQMGIAIALMWQERAALDQALSVASLINGPVLGVFLVGTFLRRAGQSAALIGMVASIAVMLGIRFGTPIAWTWYAVIGCGVTFGVAWLASLALPDNAPLDTEKYSL